MSRIVHRRVGDKPPVAVGAQAMLVRDSIATPISTIAPPFIATDADLSEIVSRLSDAIDAALVCARHQAVMG